MIPVNRTRTVLAVLLSANTIAAAGFDAPSAPQNPAPGVKPAAASVAISCLPSGNGYLHARLGGALDKTIDWPNSGTRCQGETRGEPPGVRLSFQRDPAGKENLLFVFGLTGSARGTAGSRSRHQPHPHRARNQQDLQHSRRLPLHRGCSDADRHGHCACLSPRSTRLLHPTRSCRARRRCRAGQHLRLRRTRHL